jgi:pyridoxine 5-phosphate synthase
MRVYINLDHVATIREARRTDEPDPVRAAVLAELGGAHGITVHLREDRRHIKERDVRLLQETVRTGLNLEMALDPEILELALERPPMQVTIVPERREEVTTEGGLEVEGEERAGRIGEVVERLAAAGVRTSLFIDPVESAVRRAPELGAVAVELHTGEYANARSVEERHAELDRLRRAAALGRSVGLAVHAGHGLTYENVGPVAAIAELEELNIGHSVVSRSVFVGMERAAREMLELVERARTAVEEGR